MLWAADGTRHTPADAGVDVTIPASALSGATTIDDREDMGTVLSEETGA